MILVIDNYDSFTYNLVHHVEDLGGETVVVRNDAATPEGIFAQRPRGIILSPGPCTPNEAGICLDLLAKAPAELPIFGVCLGHQAIGQAYGGEVVSARAIMHGKSSTIRNHGGGVFRGLPEAFQATRYHSLAIRRASAPAALIIDAETEDGEIMGVHHRDRPVFGVQFHPESIASEHGHKLIANFLAVCGVETASAE
jgi:anthranilate synthase component 2